MKNPEKHRYLFFVIVFVGLLSLFYTFVTPDTTKSVGSPFVLAADCTTATTTTVGTSSLSYLTPGNGTTTLTCYTGDTDQLNIQVLELASSTLTDLRWRVEYSHSTSSVPGYRIFYPETGPDATNATNTRQILKEYRWQFASTTSHRLGTSTAVTSTFQQNDVNVFNFELKDIASQYTRIEFYIPFGAAGQNTNTTAIGTIPSATSTNAGIYVHSIQHKPIP